MAFVRLNRWGQRAAAHWHAFTESAASGLPRWRVVSIFPALVLVGFVVLVVLQLSGTSSGAHWINLGSGPDPHLLYGAPRMIRSDEWLVQQSWVVSQSHQGWPTVNPIFPGGVDMTVLNELPSWDWTSLLRPHLWGYLLFGLAPGVAWAWWLPGVAVVIASYLFFVTINPRRPITAALIAAAVFFTPLIQWWFGPSTMWPVAWALLAMTGVIWVLRDPRRWVRYLWAFAVGYFAVTMAMGLYVPFIIPVIIAFLFFVVGALLQSAPWREGGLRGRISRLGPLVVAGFASLAIVAVWAVQRAATISAVTSTVYPGQRTSPPGGMLTSEFPLSILGAPWNTALKTFSGLTALGPNSSEGSAVILMCLFLAPALLWFTLSRYRRDHSIDWISIAVLASLVFVFVYLYVPGWDGLAHILQLDRVRADRFQVVFIVLLPVVTALIVKRVDEVRERSTLLAGALTTVVVAALLGVTAVALNAADPELFTLTRFWPIVVVLIIGSVALLFIRRTIPVAAVLLLAASLMVGWNVNPIYRGVFDLTETTLGDAIETTDDADPGEWVGVGSYETMAVLVQSGVASFSGVQTYPSVEMWNEIDPTGRYEEEWNRLAHIQWEFGSGEPTMTNPRPDVVRVVLDPCSTFAGEHVDFVLTDDGPASSECLREVMTVQQGALLMRIYEVVPAP